MSEAKLSCRDLRLSFRGVVALDGFSFDLKEREILGIIGPNGAGKTCALNCINGFYRPQHGVIYFEGRDITHWRPHRVANLGLAGTFQKIQLYSGLSVIDNLLAGRHMHFKSSFIEGFVFAGRVYREELNNRRIVEDIIDFLDLQSVRKKEVGLLPYGLRKRVALGRALAADPKVLLLDEPLAGMNVEEKEDMARFIIDVLEERGIAIVLVEHDMGVVMDISDRVIVLDFGRKIAEGTPEEIKGEPLVIQAYLGEG